MVASGRLWYGVVVCGSDGCLRSGVVVCDGEWLSAVASGCLRSGVVVCGSG